MWVAPGRLGDMSTIYNIALKCGLYQKAQNVSFIITTTDIFV